MKSFKKIISTITIICITVIQSFSQVDSMKNILYTNTLPDNFNPKIEKIDTVLDMFQIFKPTEKASISVSHLGNIGSAYISNIFNKRTDEYETDFSFNLPYDVYILKPTNVKYYNTRKPYTEIFYVSSTKEKDEMSVDFIHTQNITPRLNVGFIYKLVSSKGEYPNQQTKNNSFVFNINYNGDKYVMYSNLIYNKFKINENGGIVDNGDINSPQANLTKASSILMNRYVFYTHKYRFGKYKSINYKDSIIKVYEPYFSIGHNFQYTGKYRNFKNVKIEGENYFSDYFYDKSTSYDSVSYKNFSNSFFLGTEQKFIELYGFGGGLFLTNEIKNYYNFKEYIYINNKIQSIDNSLTLKFYRDDKKQIGFDFSANYYLSGSRFNDTRIELLIYKRFGNKTDNPEISILTRYTNKKPEHFIEQLNSNHFIWENNFSNTERLFAELKFKIPLWRFEIGGNIEQLNKYIYFAELAKPIQIDRQLFVQTAFISKKIKLGKWHTTNQIIWQKSTNEDIINIPEFVFFHSSYVELQFKKILTLHLGIDLNYTTSYKAMNYNPSVGQFFYENNNTIKTGNYPIGSIFANALIKESVLLFIKFEHVNSGLVQDLYYTTNHYPINNRMFKVGVRWTFPN